VYFVYLFVYFVLCVLCVLCRVVPCCACCVCCVVRVVRVVLCVYSTEYSTSYSTTTYCTMRSEHHASSSSDRLGHCCSLPRFAFFGLSTRLALSSSSSSLASSRVGQVRGRAEIGRIQMKRK